VFFAAYFSCFFVVFWRFLLGPPILAAGTDKTAPPLLQNPASKFEPCPTLSFGEGL
jgi:hypothetical protein